MEFVTTSSIIMFLKAGPSLDYLLLVSCDSAKLTDGYADLPRNVSLYETAS